MKYEPNRTRGSDNEYKDVLCPKCGRPTFSYYTVNKKKSRCVCDKPVVIGEIRGIATPDASIKEPIIDQLTRYGFEKVTILSNLKITTGGHSNTTVNKYLINLVSGEHVFVYHYRYGELVQLLTPDGNYYSSIPEGGKTVNARLRIWGDLIHLVLKTTGLARDTEDKKILYKAPDYDAEQERRNRDAIMEGKRKAASLIERKKAEIREKEQRIVDINKEITRLRQKYIEEYGEVCPA